MKKTMSIALIVSVLVLVIIHFTASREMHFHEEVRIEKNIDDVWEVLGNQFTEPHLWSKNFKTSEPGGEPKLSGLTYLHRATTTDKGVNWQELDAYDPANYSLSYHVSKGVPSVAKTAKGHWRLTKIDENQTRMDIEFILETKGLLRFLMSPILNIKISQAGGELAEEFKYYLENGKPHPRKLKDLNN